MLTTDRVQLYTEFGTNTLIMCSCMARLSTSMYVVRSDLPPGPKTCASANAEARFRFWSAAVACFLDWYMLSKLQLYTAFASTGCSFVELPRL